MSSSYLLLIMELEVKEFFLDDSHLHLASAFTAAGVEFKGFTSFKERLRHECIRTSLIMKEGKSVKEDVYTMSGYGYTTFTFTLEGVSVED
jgi:hypothetical protein